MGAQNRWGACEFPRGPGPGSQGDLGLKRWRGGTTFPDEEREGAVLASPVPTLSPTVKTGQNLPKMLAHVVDPPTALRLVGRCSGRCFESTKREAGGSRFLPK